MLFAAVLCARRDGPGQGLGDVQRGRARQLALEAGEAMGGKEGAQRLGRIGPSSKSSSGSGSAASSLSATSWRERRAMSACSIRLSRSLLFFISGAAASACSSPPCS
jgi:hypothetical protein